MKQYLKKIVCLVLGSMLMSAAAADAPGDGGMAVQKRNPADVLSGSSRTVQDPAPAAGLEGKDNLGTINTHAPRSAASPPANENGCDEALTPGALPGIRLQTTLDFKRIDTPPEIACSLRYTHSGWTVAASRNWNRPGKIDFSIHWEEGGWTSSFGSITLYGLPFMLLKPLSTGSADRFFRPISTSVSLFPFERGGNRAQSPTAAISIPLFVQADTSMTGKLVMDSSPAGLSSSGAYRYGAYLQISSDTEVFQTGLVRHGIADSVRQHILDLHSQDWYPEALYGRGWSFAGATAGVMLYQKAEVINAGLAAVGAADQADKPGFALAAVVRGSVRPLAFEYNLLLASISFPQVYGIPDSPVTASRSAAVQLQVPGKLALSIRVREHLHGWTKVMNPKLLAERLGEVDMDITLGPLKAALREQLSYRYPPDNGPFELVHASSASFTVGKSPLSVRTKIEKEWNNRIPGRTKGEVSAVYRSESISVSLTVGYQAALPTVHSEINFYKSGLNFSAAASSAGTVKVQVILMLPE